MEIYSFGGDIHENCNFLIGFVFVSAQHEDSTGFFGHVGEGLLDEFLNFGNKKLIRFACLVKWRSGYSVPIHSNLLFYPSILHEFADDADNSGICFL